VCPAWRVSFVATRGQNSRRATGGSIAGQTTASTIIDKGSPTPVRQDKQMANTALALLDTVTEPAIAVEV
jgi:hypothetical protein